MEQTKFCLVPSTDFESTFECPVCLEFFEAPIYVCESGHSICSTCTSQITKCPTCRANITKRLRNYILEKQLSLLHANCRFEGCGRPLTLATMSAHEKSCTFNPNLKCILQNCKWFGHKTALLSHLNSKHKIPLYDICGDTAEYSSRLRSAALPSTAGCVKLLHTFYLPDGRITTILTYIFMDSARNLFYPQFRTFDDRPVRYTLKIWNTDSSDCDEICVSGLARTLNTSLEEERDQKKCVVLDLESLINIFAFSDKSEEGHKLLHYKLSLN